MFYPLLFKPIYKEVVWGGRNLEDKLKRQLPKDKKIGESWEITYREEGISIIDNGIFAGIGLDEIIKRYPIQILGTEFKYNIKGFPLLLKIIDANDNLSVQVHPDGENGKTEAWYILHAEPGAKIVYGLKDSISKIDFINALKENKVTEVINEVEVNSGELYLIPGGMIHSLGKGVIVAEIQQNSNTTYRVYDWGRLGLDGKPRQLHIEQALSVIRFKGFDNAECAISQESSVIDMQERVSCRAAACCEYFTIEEIEADDEYFGCLKGDRFEIIFLLNGRAELHYSQGELMEMEEYQSVLLPATLGEYSIKGKCRLLRIYI